VSASTIYGGTINLFAVTMKRMGIEVSFVSPYADEAEIQAAVRPNTKAFFGETIANPSIDIFDIERWAGIAHRNGLPLLVDNTFATPVLGRPFEFGADIVVSLHHQIYGRPCRAGGGVIVDSGNFDWSCGQIPRLYRAG
jgi:O-acetylhomoserine (thiol)-lyase